MSDETNNNWRAFAREVVQLSTELCDALPSDVTDNQHLTIALLYARSRQSFLSALALAELGFNGDARTVVRSAVESTIAIAATAKDASFTTRLIEADMERRLKWSRATLSDPELEQGMSSDELDRLRANVATIEPTKPKGINWSDAARDSGTKVLYHLHYRPMSWHAHVGVESLNSYAVLDGNEEIAGVRFDGNMSGYADTVSAACDVLFWASMVTAESFDFVEVVQRIRALHQRYSEMTKPSSL